MILSRLKILFHNCNGLDPAKFRAYRNFIHSETYDIIIVQEHWFVRRFDWQSDSCVALISIPPPVSQERRSGGGLAILIHPSKQHLLTTLLSTPYSLVFSYNSVIIATSYLPPSTMNLEDIKQ